ncbi:hypothetical protein [Streptomyces sp. NBC_01500]|uniref:hypothetical protein n=1 Tax=Streptomyces sp. NBC_01500 TaxID=2903886 RepID=UPI0022545C74|nr:hypothetical protein [Streptomyces sp. NBC_01500]MCX4554111.1 hypothetical protein [Streptomyces sp. NBC_01500]
MFQPIYLEVPMDLESLAETMACNMKYEQLASFIRDVAAHIADSEFDDQVIAAIKEDMGG